MKTRKISDKALQTLIGMSPEPVYSVLTYDMPSERYTPQDGLPAICARSELRSVLRALRKDGYEACKGDSAVLIERIEFTEIASYIQRHNPS